MYKSIGSTDNNFLCEVPKCYQRYASFQRRTTLEKLFYITESK